jgi:hypothetical protein
MTQQPPKFVWIVLVVLGCLDLVRGFMHTVLLEVAAIHIAGLDLSSGGAADLLRLLGTFGISNWITGALYVLIGLKARRLALPALAVIPLAYALGVVTIRITSIGYGASEANWGGIPFMIVYLGVCVVTLGAGLIASRRAARN